MNMLNGCISSIVKWYFRSYDAIKVLDMYRPFIFREVRLLVTYKWNRCAIIIYHEGLLSSVGLATNIEINI